MYIYIYIYIYIYTIYYIYIYMYTYIYIYTAEKTQTTQRYFKGKLLLPLGNNISNFVQCIKLSILYGQEPICCKYTFCILFFVLDTFVNCLFFRGQCSQQFQKYAILSLFRIGLFEAAHGRGKGRGWGKNAPFPKICHTYPTMMKLGTEIPYLKNTQKHMNHVKHPLSCAETRTFLSEISIGYIRKYRYIGFCYIISNSFNFF